MTHVRTKNFEYAITTARSLFRQETTQSKFWQGVDVSGSPEMAMHEVLFYSFETPMPTEDLDHYRADIKPNLPWADEHFEQERVSGQPINPGETWKTWPYGHSASKFLDDRGQFNHSYAERYWPKYAGFTPEGKVDLHDEMRACPRRGIRHEYADLNDLLNQLHKDPLTRQAYLPVWFPEDGSHLDRKPCTLGYHFILRENKLHVAYYIRSCDFVRHFRDDIYLTVRLLLWVLDQMRLKDPRWKTVIPGDFVMHITSLHMFRNDYLSDHDRQGKA